MSPRLIALIVSILFNFALLIAVVWLCDRLEAERKFGRALIARIKGQA